MPTEFEMEHGTKNSLAVINAYFDIYPDKDPHGDVEWADEE